MTAQDVGRALRAQREQRGLTLETAADATRIRRHYLTALEEGDFGALPSAAQVRGFLRAYAEYLDLDSDELLAQLKPAEPALTATPSPTPEAAPTETVEPKTETSVLPAFAAIGDQLRERREQMELTLLEVEENTHIPAHYLSRLEAGQFDTFPSPTQARGMLGNYSEFLGLESEELLLSYAEAIQTRFQARAAAAKPPRPKFVPPKLPQIKLRLPDWAQPLLTRDIAFGALAGFALLAFLLFSIGRVLTTQAQQVDQPTAPPMSVALLSTDTLGPGTPSAAPGTGESINLLAQQTNTPGLVGQATIQVTGSGAINLRLLATQRTWMRVTVDGNVAFEGRTAPGQSYSFAANGQILLFTGNGSGLRAFLNDQDLGIVGIFGEVVTMVFNSQGAATPTLSPTPTIDPNVLTATADFLLTPSATPSPTSTETPEPSATPVPE